MKGKRLRLKPGTGKGPGSTAAIKGSLIYFNEAPPSIPEGLEKRRGFPEIKALRESIGGAEGGWERERKEGRKGERAGNKKMERPEMRLAGIRLELPDSWEGAEHRGDAAEGTGAAKECPCHHTGSHCRILPLPNPGIEGSGWAGKD